MIERSATGNSRKCGECCGKKRRVCTFQDTRSFRENHEEGQETEHAMEQEVHTVGKKLSGMTLSIGANQKDFFFDKDYMIRFESTS